MKKCKLYYISMILFVFIFILGGFLLYLGFTYKLIYVNSTINIMNTINFCLWFGFLFLIASLLLIVVNQDKNTDRYYKKIKIPVTDFSITNYTNNKIIALDTYGWCLDLHSKIRYEKLLKKDGFITITNYYNKDYELIKKYLDL